MAADNLVVNGEASSKKESLFRRLKRSLSRRRTKPGTKAEGKGEGSPTTAAASSAPEQVVERGVQGSEPEDTEFVVFETGDSATVVPETVPESEPVQAAGTSETEAEPPPVAAKPSTTKTRASARATRAPGSASTKRPTERTTVATKAVEPAVHPEAAVDEFEALEPAGDAEERAEHVATARQVVKTIRKPRKGRLPREPDEREIMLLERELRQHRTTLDMVLKKKEEALRLKAQDLRLRAAKLKAKESSLSQKDSELKAQIEKINKDLSTIKEIKAEIDAGLEAIKGMSAKWADWKKDGNKLVSAIDKIDTLKLTQPGVVEKKVGIDEDVKALLRALDNLLEKLPTDAVEAFSKTKNYELYLKVFDKYKIK